MFYFPFVYIFCKMIMCRQLNLFSLTQMVREFDRNKKSLEKKYMNIFLDADSQMHIHIQMQIRMIFFDLINQDKSRLRLYLKVRPRYFKKAFIKTQVYKNQTRWESSYACTKSKFLAILQCFSPKWNLHLVS